MNPTARNAVAAARFLILPFLGIALAFLPACSKAKQTASRAAEATKDAASRAADATKDAASRAADATLDAAAKTGRAVGETAGNFFSGVGEGVERAIVAYDVDLSAPSLAPIGPSVNLVRHVTENRDEFLLVYFLNQAPADGTLRVRLTAADGREIGRSELPVSLPADSAAYLRFPVAADIPFDLVRSVAFSFLQQTAPETGN
ncbi:MAG: hypothetical protein IKQ55_13280 [Kiritimatiellae bacterium]|nr:hypothetical protein [Kiritimatiellia bacterium]